MPEPLTFFARMLIFFGLIMVALGAIFLMGGKLLPFGRLPGDIHIQRENFSFYFPLATCILLSVLLTLLANIFARR